jgi:DNA polymerase I-like protein with 3'-5' exonuclease and polymerase domains
MSQIPLFQPDSEWVPPEKIPNLSDATEIAIDLETYDPDLKTLGPGWTSGNGYVVGVAIAVEGWKGYFPMRHQNGGGNFDENIVKRQLKKILELPCDKIFHNASYDVGWLRRWGLEVKGRIIDTLIAAPLIDENRFRYSLNDLGKDYLKDKKSEALLYEAAGAWSVDAKSEMYKLPAMYVGPYAEQDADLTLRLWQFFKTELIKQELSSIFDLETRLFPCLLDMTWKGVRVDLEKAEKIKKNMQAQEEKILQQIKKDTNIDVEIWAAVSVAKAFDKLKIKYERTEKNKQPKFDKNFLTTHKHPLAKMIVQAREINKARTTFIDTILRHSVHSRIHAHIHQMRGDTGGTVTGRFSYSNPNLQQIPARNKEIGPLIRSIFVPDEGCTWGSFDYSQQEPRVLVHFASLTSGGLKGADEVIESYKTEDPDFHQAVADMAGIDRRTAKTINLGMMYGMGKGKLASSLGLDKYEAEDLFEKFHTNVPFVKQLMEQATRKADHVGFLRTLLGRKCRFDLWEPRAFGIHRALPLWEAEKEYGRDLKRAWTYKALNRLIQGSSADMTKKAMVDLYEEGILSHIQVHDELNCSIQDKEQATKIKEIMEHTVELKVPLKVDMELGPSWGEIRKK